MADVRAEFLAVRNFDRFQHYKDRAVPSWIKLYAALLHDYDFQQLPDDSKGHLMLIWLLVSQRNDRRIPNDPRWVAAQIGATSRVNLKTLTENGWLVPVDCKGREVANPADSLEKGSRGSVPTIEIVDSGAVPPLLSSPLISSSQEGESEGKPVFDGTPQDLMESWNEVCVPAGLSAVEKLSPTRRQKAALRLKENPKDQFWETVLNRVAGSAFLRGLKNGNGKHEHWKASFDWLIDNDTNAVKIYEGRYDG